MQGLEGMNPRDAIREHARADGVTTFNLGSMIVQIPSGEEIGIRDQLVGILADPKLQKFEFAVTGHKYTLDRGACKILAEKIRKFVYPQEIRIPQEYRQDSFRLDMEQQKGVKYKIS